MNARILIVIYYIFYSQCWANNKQIESSVIVDSLTENVDYICRNGSKKGFMSKMNTKKSNMTKIKLELKKDMFSNIEIKKSEWKGIQQVLHRHQLEDNKSYRKCVSEITPLLLSKLNNIKSNATFSNQLSKAIFTSIYLSGGIETSMLNIKNHYYTDSIKGLVRTFVLKIGTQLNKYIAAEIKYNTKFSEYDAIGEKGNTVMIGDDMFNVHSITMSVKQIISSNLLLFIPNPIGSNFIKNITPYLIVGFLKGTNELENYSLARSVQECSCPESIVYKNKKSLDYTSLSLGLGLAFKLTKNSNINLEYNNFTTKKTDIGDKNIDNIKLISNNININFSTSLNFY